MLVTCLKSPLGMTTRLQEQAMVQTALINCSDAFQNDKERLFELRTHLSKLKAGVAIENEEVKENTVSVSISVVPLQSILIITATDTSLN